jgi:hypothetical protein
MLDHRIAHTTRPGPDDVLSVDELLERLHAGATIDGLRSRFILPMAGGDGEGEGTGDGGKGDDEAGKGEGKGDDEAGKGEGDDEGDDDEEGGSELERARRAAAAAKKEAKDLKTAREKEQREAAEKAGRWEELAKKAQAKVDELEERIETEARERTVIAELVKAKAENPERAVRLIDKKDLEEVETDADAVRVVKALKRSDGYLFAPDGPRQRRTRGDDDDDDTNRGRRGGGSDDDDEGKSKPKAVGVDRLRRGYAASSSK